MELNDIGQEVLELRSSISRVEDLIISLSKDVEKLSKIPSWEKVQIKRPQDTKTTSNVLDSIKQARSHLKQLKSSYNVDTTEISTENILSRCLQMQLQQSKRDRRELELQLKLPSNPTPEIVYKVLEQLIQEKS